MAIIGTDPVCGMELEEAEAVVQLQHKGQMVYFCSLACIKTFSEMVEETSNAFRIVDTPSEAEQS